jgi:hypothetical protein
MWHFKTSFSAAGRNRNLLKVTLQLQHLEDLKVRICELVVISEATLWTELHTFREFEGKTSHLLEPVGKSVSFVIGKWSKFLIKGQ